MLAATAKRSDRSKRQLFIYPRTEADSPLPARNWPSSHFLLHLLSLGRLRKMRSGTPRPQPTFFRTGPGEAGEGGEEGDGRPCRCHEKQPPFKIARNLDRIGLTFWSLASI